MAYFEMFYKCFIHSLIYSENFCWAVFLCQALGKKGNSTMNIKQGHSDTAHILVIEDRQTVCSKISKQ